MLGKLIWKEKNFIFKCSILFGLILLSSFNDYPLENTTYSILPKMEVLKNTKKIIRTEVPEGVIIEVFEKK